MNKKILSGVLGLAFAATAFADEAPKSLEDRVSALENKGYLDMFTFGGTLINRYDHITSRVKNGTFNPIRTYFALNADAKVNDRVSFYSRFAMDKYWNTLNNQRVSGFDNITPSRGETGAGVYVEKAFMNYKFNPSLVMSVGRLPTLDGPPYHFFDALPRQGTYPMMAYSSALDGLALSYNLNMLPEGHHLTVRGIYTPLTANNQDQNSQAAAPMVSGISTAINSPKFHSQAPIFTGMVDYNTDKIGFVDQWNTIVQFVSLGRTQVGDVVPRGSDLGVFTSNPGAGGNGIPTATGVLFKGSNLEFKYTNMIFYQELQNIAKTNISLGASFLMTHTQSEGQIEQNATIQAAVPSVFTAGALTNSANDKKNGHALLLTASYRLPVDSMNNPVFGVEFLKSSQNYLFFSSGADDLTNFYSTRGKGYHFWYTQPFGGLKWRTGMTFQDNEYTKGFLGTPTATNGVNSFERGIYTQLRLDI